MIRRGGGRPLLAGSRVMLRSALLLEMREVPARDPYGRRVVRAVLDRDQTVIMGMTPRGSDWRRSGSPTTRQFSPKLSESPTGVGGVSEATYAWSRAVDVPHNPWRVGASG